MLEFELLLTYSITYVSLLVTIFSLLTLLEGKKIKKVKWKKLPKVSVLIPAHNEENTIKETLDSLQKLKYPKNKLEIIVVDDGSTDNTYRIVKEYGKKVKVFRKKRGGKASALNFGIKKCKGDFVLALDADSIVERNYLLKVLKYFDENVMAVVPNIKVQTRKNFWEKLQSIEYTLNNFLKRILWFASSMHVVPGAPVFRAKFLRKNKFDEGNLTEDLEMGLRIKSKGYEIAYAYDAYAYTKVPSNFRGLFRQRLRWYFGLLHNFKKYGFMFGLKYGDLSFFVLPTILITVALSCLFLIYTITKLALDVWDIFYFSKYLGITFQVARRFQPSIVVDTLLNEHFYFSLVLLALGLLFYRLATKRTKEKPSLAYFPYILAYGWLLFAFNLIAAILFLIGKKPKW